MNWVLVRKLLRDVRVSLLAVCVLLCAIFFLWCKITQQTVDFMEQLNRNSNLGFLKNLFFQTDSGKLAQKMMGGSDVDAAKAVDSMSIGLMHPLVQTILCVWAIGRAAGAIAGELDRGTMELLLAQPIPRYQVVTAHLMVDVLMLPLLCLSIWLGIVVGSWTFGLFDLAGTDPGKVNPLVFWRPLLNVGALLFAVSGVTMALSACGRLRTRVLGVAVLLMLVQFLVNLIGQLWKLVEGLRPFTLFNYYQPQPILLGKPGAEGQLVLNVAVLVAVGCAGYAIALTAFCRRDLPAPL